MLIAVSAPKASEREGRLNRYLWVFLAVTNAVDVLASRRAFQIGIGEANPLVDLIVSDYGVLGLGLFKAFWIVILLLLLPYIRGWTQGLLALTCCAYFALTLAHIRYLSPLL